MTTGTFPGKRRVTFLLILKKVPVKRRLAFFCKKGKTKDLVISVVRRFRSVFMI